MWVGEGARRENWGGGRGELENLSSEAKSGLNREGGGGLNGTFMVNLRNQTKKKKQKLKTKTNSVTGKIC